MKVQDVMTSPARSCRPVDTLVEAARTMWDNDCGALPVLDNEGRPAGMITDRDICMAVARTNRFPGDIRVREVMSAHPFLCKGGDETGEALVTMAKQQIRRLPVVDENGCLTGIVSISDIAAGAEQAGARRADEVHSLVIRALLAIIEKNAHPAGSLSQRPDVGR
jgi:CBS domain-containing protein